MPIEETDDGEEWIPDFTPLISQEQRLWLEVLYTYFHDMEWYGSRDNVATHLLHLAASEEGEHVCDMAGVDYDYFISKLFSLYRRRKRNPRPKTRERWIKETIL